MSLTECKECKQQISTSVQMCPHCGAKPPRKSSLFALTVLALSIALGIILLTVISPPTPVYVPPAEDTSHAQNQIEELRQKAEQGDADAQINLALAYALGRGSPRNYNEANVWYEKAQQQGRNNLQLEEILSDYGYFWRYSHIDDGMSSHQVHSAVLRSLNTVNFGFPYTGSQRAELTLRNHPRYGKDIIFQIEKGQILCPSYGSCNVLVRFDDAAATNFTAVGAADHSTEIIFIKNYNRFVEKMLRADKVQISASIYQEGNPVFEFHVSSFDQDQYKAAH